jgi:uncharacterized protein YqjF (DUF2071 family)
MATQTWHDVSFLHWRIDSGDIAPRLPAGLKPDLVDGSAWVSIVAFRIEHFRPLGLPTLTSSFPETNLRTYVIDRSGRDGVWFLSVDVSNLLNVAGGRLMGIPYHWSDMQAIVEHEQVRYRCRRRVARPAFHDIAVELRPFGSAAQPMVADSLAGRWRAFSRVGRLWEVPVEHEPWPLQAAHLAHLNESLFRAVGLPRPSTDPLVQYASGLPARLGWPRRPGPSAPFR